MAIMVYRSIIEDKKHLNLGFSMYRNTSPLKGVILYFHGGGLLYGSRNDLPELHKEKLTSNGYAILSFDYRLAPEAKFEQILSDVKYAVDFFLKTKDDLGLDNVPYFLWGRSAGAYISLLLSTMDFSQVPNGVISYYGYGFTVDGWFNTPSRFYLKYPKVKREDTIKATKGFFIGNGHVYERLIIYLYARQTGTWLSMFTGENEIDFLSKYSLKDIDKDLPPAFFAYSFKDNDVPFEESIELQEIFKNHSIFTTSVDAHDFDRDEKSDDTIKLLDKTLDFLNENL